jgi:hypothetical protein
MLLLSGLIRTKGLFLQQEKINLLRKNYMMFLLCFIFMFNL